MSPAVYINSFAFLFLFCWSCTQGDIVLTQPSLNIVKPGQSASLPCSASGYTLTNHHIHWAFQAAGHGLQWIGAYRYDTTYISDKYKGRVAFSLKQSTFVLGISSLTEADNGVYYCARAGSNYFDYWGPGTSVTVSPDPISAPMVYPLLPCCTGMGSQEPVTIGCLATGYLPDPVNMTWNSDSITTGVNTLASVYSSARGVYMRSSLLTVPADSWINSTYQCTVQHEYTGWKQDKTVTVLPCTAPSVKTFLSPPCDPFSDGHATGDMNGTTMEIMCVMWGFHPGHLQVQWLANGRPTSLPASTKSPSKGKDGWFSASSRLTVSKGEWNLGTFYTCRVTHPSTETSMLANISKCAEPCPCLIGVFLLPPSYEDLYLSQRAHLTCLVTNMKTTESFEVLWARGNGAELEVVTDDAKLHNNGTFTVVSRLSICAEDWRRGEKFSCTIKHPDLPSPVKVEIAKLKEGSLNPPAVYLLPPSPQEVALQELVTLSCLVKGFNPKDIFVRWLQKDQEVGKGHYTSTDPIAVLTGGSYFLYSSLQVAADIWEAGVPFSCVVGHEALPMHLTQKTVDKFTDFTDILFDVNALRCTKDDYKMTTALFMVLFLLSLFFSATITAYKACSSSESRGRRPKVSSGWRNSARQAEQGGGAISNKEKPATNAGCRKYDFL